MARSLAMELDFAPGRALGDETGDFADGLTNDLTSQTHEQNLNVPNGYASIGERLHRFTQTRIGRLTMFAALLPPAAVLTACGPGESAGPDGEHSAVASPNGVGGGEDTLKNGDVIIITRAECVVTDQTLEAYAAMSAAEQEACQEDIAALPADKIEKLSPLSQARWMAYYRKHKLDMPGAMIDIDLKSFESALEQKDSRDGMAGVFLTLHGNNVAALAWHTQQPESANDDRTRWALFGPGTAADAPAVKDAERIAGAMSAKGHTLEEYVNAVPGRFSLLHDSGSIEDIAASKNPDGTWNYSFTAARTEDGARQSFAYQFMPYLADDGPALSRGELYEVESRDTEFLGQTLAVLPEPA